MTDLPPKKHVLFLCTGNYYRSRFAEIYFNHKAINTSWISFSRGLELDSGNYGAISSIVIRELAKLGIPVENPPYPKQAEFEDLKKAGVIVCMNKVEHERMIDDKFPQFEKDIIYWDIYDIFEKDSSSEVPKIIHDVDQLLKKLIDQG